MNRLELGIIADTSFRSLKFIYSIKYCYSWEDLL